MTVVAYSKVASYYHWLVAAPLIGSVGAVLKAQQAPKQEKGTWMWRHKSLGLLTGMIVAPRVGYRLFNMAKYNSVPHLPGTGKVEGVLANISHYSLYAFMTIMPATGIAMGLYGGKGLPFFNTQFSGLEKNGKIAGTSFKIHKTLGTYGKYLIPVHAGAAVGHAARGQSIFARINPFRGGPKH